MPACMSISPWAAFRDASDILIQAEETQKTKTRITKLYAEHCGQSYAEVEAKLDRDCFMTAEEARTWGMIDSVLDKKIAI